MTPHLRGRIAPLARVDAIASRAIELLDYMYHTDDGIVILLDFDTPDGPLREAHDTTMRGAEILVRRGLAEWIEPHELGPRLALDCVRQGRVGG